MKKKLIMAIIAVLLFTQIPINVNANTPQDNTYLTQYDSYVKGYGKHIAEVHYNVASKELGNHEQAKIYYEQFRNNIKTDGFLDSVSRKVQGITGYDRMVAIDRELSTAIIGGALSAWDTVKGWFNDFKGLFSKEEVRQPQNVITESNMIIAPLDYSFYFTFRDGRVMRGDFLFLEIANYCNVVRAAFNVRGTTSTPDYAASITYKSTCSSYIGYGGVENFYDWIDRQTNLTLGNYVALLSESGSGVRLTLEHKQSRQEVPIYFNVTQNKTVQDLDDFIKKEDMSKYVPKDYKPVVQTYLTCGNEVKTLTVENNKFRLPTGELIEIGKDETVVLNGVTCKLGFKFPTSEVVEDKVIVKNPDGTNTDLGKQKQDEINEKPSCDGVMCWLSSIWDGVKDTAKGVGSFVSAIADIVKAIADLGLKIADLFIDLLDKLFHLVVPENLDFITDSFDGISDTFNIKFAIIGDIKDMFTGLFVATEKNPISKLSFSLPAANNKEFSLSSFSIVDEFVPMLKRIISGVVMLMTVVYVYRKITGTGGVMEK